MPIIRGAEDDGPRGQAGYLNEHPVLSPPLPADFPSRG